VFHDPYARVGIRDILLAPVTLEVLLFYLFGGALGWILWKDAFGRHVVVLLAVAAVCVLLFTVVLFEPGGHEKYLPAYPFFFLAVGAAWQQSSRKSTHAFMALFLIGILCGGNIYSKATWRREAAYHAFLDRKNALERVARPDSLVALVDFWDPLYRMPALLLL